MISSKLSPTSTADNVDCQRINIHALKGNHTGWVLIPLNYCQETDNFSFTNRCFCFMALFGGIGTLQILNIQRPDHVSFHWQTGNSTPAHNRLPDNRCCIVSFSVGISGLQFANKTISLKKICAYNNINTGIIQ